jgi:GGDEF domain-containing protein
MGGLTVRPSGRDQSPVGEYSVSTDLPDRTAFARWLDRPSPMRAWRDRCAVLLIHIADFREVDEVFEVRADDILAQDAGALAQAALEPHHFLARLARDEFAVGVPNWCSTAARMTWVACWARWPNSWRRAACRCRSA